MLAFTVVTVGDTLQIDQTVVDGEFFTLLGDTFVQVQDETRAEIFDTQDNVSIKLLDGAQHGMLGWSDLHFPGNVAIDASEGDNLVVLDPRIDGELRITGGDGIQTLSISSGSSYGSLIFDLGNGCDTLVDPAPARLETAGDFVLKGVNRNTDTGRFVVGGDLTLDTTQDDCEANSFDLNPFVDGDLTIRMSEASEVEIIGVVDGAINYIGGDRLDDVRVLLFENPTNLRIDLGAGPGDIFIGGTLEWNTQLQNYKGFSFFYDHSSGNVDLIQTADMGDVFIDDNGIDNAIQFRLADEFFRNLAPANNLRVIMLDDSSGSLHADFDNPRNGSTVFQLRGGDRQLVLEGASNTYNGLLRVEAASGDQEIVLAEFMPLTVNGNLVVNTRDGNDTISASRALEVDGAAYLRGVNNIVNSHGLSTGGDFNVVTLDEDQNTRLINNSSFTVGGNVHYLGGGGVDTINFKTNGATIAGYTYINIATANDLNIKQTVKLTGGYTTTSLVIDAGTAAAGNFFLSDADLMVSGGLLVVNFSESTTSNTAIFQGNYGGTYGTYRGGSNSDFVEFAATTDQMEFAFLSFAGDDVLTVRNTTVLDFLFADFGVGGDSLDNQFGNQFPFESRIVNL